MIYNRDDLNLLADTILYEFLSDEWIALIRDEFLNAYVSLYSEDNETR